MDSTKFNFFFWALVTFSSLNYAHCQSKIFSVANYGAIADGKTDITLLFQNIHITAPEDSPNTDGIHIGNSNHVRIEVASIATGDDCVSIGSGNTNISVSGVVCGPGHGIRIGSLGKYKNEKDVSGIIVRDCTFRDTENGARIKTWAPSKSAARLSDVQFINIRVENNKNPILIDQYYCSNSPYKHNGESSIQIKDVKFIGVKGKSASKVGVNVQCSDSHPCENIEFRLQKAGS